MDAARLTAVIVGQLSENVLASVGLPGVGLVLDAVLQEFVAVQDAQLEAIRQIDKKVDRLLNGPWNTAKLLIQEARLPDRSPDQRTEALKAAANKLREAIPLQDDRSFGRAFASLDLAMISRLLNDHDLAQHYAKGALRAANHFALDIQAGKVRPPGYRQMIATMVGFAPITAGLWAIAAPLMIGSDLINRQVDELNTLKGVPADYLTTYDDKLNKWLDEIYTQLHQIQQSAELLCPAGDEELDQLIGGAPRAMRFLRFRLTTS